MLCGEFIKKTFKLFKFILKQEIKKMKVLIIFSNKSKEHSLNEVLTYDEVLRLIKKHVYIIDDMFFDFDIDRGAIWFDMHAAKFNLSPHFFKNTKKATLYFYLHRKISIE